MTQDIIEMAKEAGIIAVHTEGDGHWHQQFIALEAFAKLVEAKASAKEREACAKVCETQEDKGGEWDVQQQCANAIRARGQ
jgi:hypothetical protein